MKLSIIIVSWNVREDLMQCLDSIEKSVLSNEFEVIVIDNGSTDGTIEAVKSEFPKVVVIANSENRGFAAANNQGIKIARGKYIMLLNPDTIVHPNSIEKLINFMDKNPDVGLCGPKLLNHDGSTQRSVRRFPTFRAAFYRHTILSLFGLFRGQYNKWLMKDFDYETQTEVCQPMGAALMTRRSVIEKVGLMDERFFMYFEEVDLCYRIKQAKWRIVFVPGATITHLGGHSAVQVPVEKRIMMLRSMFSFFRKHYGHLRTSFFGIIFKPLVLLTYFYYLCRDIVKYIFAFFLFNHSRQVRCTRRIRNWKTFLGKYSWQLLFKT